MSARRRHRRRPSARRLTPLAVAGVLLVIRQRRLAAADAAHPEIAHPA